MSYFVERVVEYLYHAYSYINHYIVANDEKLWIILTYFLFHQFACQDIVTIYKRRGGSDRINLPHHEWLQTVQLEPDVISVSFIPITSLLNGVPGSGFLSHAINLYLRCE